MKIVSVKKLVIKLMNEIGSFFDPYLSVRPFLIYFFVENPPKNI